MSKSKKHSAGILLYRFLSNDCEVFLVHPGGPFWAKKDLGAWSIPKGEFEENEDPLAAAAREFEEETGITISGKYLELTPIKQKSGKTVHAWAIEGDLDPNVVRSNTFEIEWPPKSGIISSFPEIDKAEWFPIPHARLKINEYQSVFLDELVNKLGLNLEQQQAEIKPDHGKNSSGQFELF